MTTRAGLPPVLGGLTLTTTGDTALSTRVCAERLTWLGACWEPSRVQSASYGGSAGPLAELTLRPASARSPDLPLTDELQSTIHWQNIARSESLLPTTEAIIQAVSGLMGVHGRDGRIPRRLGLEVACVVAGLLATQGILAALIGHRRSLPVRCVETSVLKAALLLLGHHLAIATCGDEFSPVAPGGASGPPFRTADGHAVELEALSFPAWVGFWSQLGVERAEAEAAWSNYIYRYLSATCALPMALHAATSRHTLADLGRIAGACGVALCRVRAYSEIVADPSFGPPWTICPGDIGASPGRSRSGDAPLSGLRVVEVTSRLQGPLAGLLLGMLGAEVIKVEPPGGDFGRHAPPLAGSLGAAYLAYNRGKQVVELDYKRPADHAHLTDLAANADVFLHNWRMDRAAKLKLDFETLARHNPGLVYAHASGWGHTGAEPTPIAGDFLVQAHAGCGDGLNPVDEPPFPSRLALVDVTGGLLACEGILAGLYWRARSGQGCRVATSLLAAAMTLQAHVLRAMAAEQEVGRRLGRPIWGPLDRPIETTDGFLVVALEGEGARRRLAEVCELTTTDPTRLGDERFIERLRSASAAEWVARLGKAGIAAAVVRTDLATLPHEPWADHLFERVNEACWAPAAPWRLMT